MSYRTFFSFSSGLAKSLYAPIGTKAAIHTHIEEVEQKLGLKRTKYLDNPVHWDHFDQEYRQGFPKVTAEVLCDTVLKHNEWVRRIYEQLGEWSQKRVKPCEKITPQEAAVFWHGFQMLSVSPERWTADYYRDRMEHLYEVMRGRENQGVTFDAAKLTPKQAAAVINIFSEYLDTNDLRLDVPRGRDYLASSYDGGYSWCDKCFCPIADDDLDCRRKKCPIMAERNGEDESEEEEEEAS